MDDFLTSTKFYSDAQNFMSIGTTVIDLRAFEKKKKKKKKKKVDKMRKLFKL